MLTTMPKLTRLLPVVMVPVLLAGCAGPERKLGRGIANLTEPVRGGEMSRSLEQTTMWEGPQKGMTVGVIRGFNRTVARTVLGVTEIPVGVVTALCGAPVFAYLLRRERTLVGS